jgi:predicted DCC family thiol-disulfide oxidoreductase YuxK
MDNLNELGGRLLVIFDGSCGLCNRAVRWLMRRDSHDRLRFAPSDSPRVAEVLVRHGLGAQDAQFGPDSIMVVSSVGGAAEQVLFRSAAVLALLAELPCAWPALASALRWIPRPARDLAYRLVARWRYRIWGRLEQCPLPAPEDRARFL